MTPTGCSADRDDHFELVRRGEARAPGQPTPLFYARANDPEAARVLRLMSDELSGELLRTYAMARRLAGETAPASSVRSARAAMPPMLALGVSDLDRGLPYRDRELRAGWWRRAIPADTPIIWIESEPDPERIELGRMLASVRPKSGAGASDAALRDAMVLDQIVNGFGRAILSLIAPAPVSVKDGAPATVDPVGEGYVTFLQVVAAEWHSGDGDQPAAEARVLLQRASRFAAVRANTSATVFRALGGYGFTELSPRPTTEAFLREPLTIAAFLYRLAASETGHRLATDETYRAMVPELPPTGISPGRLLGAFRNFQAKLFWAWNRVTLANRPPRDLIELVEAYADAFPAERAEVIRIFLVTTKGVTALPGGVFEARAEDEVASQYSALTADVLFGRLRLRAAMPPLALPVQGTPLAPFLP